MLPAFADLFRPLQAGAHGVNADNVSATFPNGHHGIQIARFEGGVKGEFSGFWRREDHRAGWG